MTDFILLIFCVASSMFIAELMIFIYDKNSGSIRIWFGIDEDKDKDEKND